VVAELASFLAVVGDVEGGQSQEFVGLGLFLSKIIVFLPSKHLNQKLEGPSWAF